MSTLSVGTIKSASSAAPVFQNSSGTEKGQLVKAWINFDGTGTVSIRDSYNISSLTDISTGIYQISYTNAFSNNDYAVTASAIEDYASIESRSPRIAGPTRSAPATGSVHIATWATDNNAYDVEECHVIVIGAN